MNDFFAMLAKQLLHLMAKLMDVVQCVGSEIVVVAIVNECVVDVDHRVVLTVPQGLVVRVEIDTVCASTRIKE